MIELDFLVIVLLVVLGGGFVVFLFLSVLSRRKVEPKPKPLQLSKAESALSGKDYNLATIQAFSAIETMLRENYNAGREKTSFELMQKFENKLGVKQDLIGAMHHFRKQRNQIAHGEQVASRDIAAEGINVAKAIAIHLGYKAS